MEVDGMARWMTVSLYKQASSSENGQEKPLLLPAASLPQDRPWH